MNIPHTPSNCYSPERKPVRAPESSQVAEQVRRINRVPEYSNVANERRAKK